ncbi:MAG: OstA-like protein [Schleiferiaceae bacterium]
MLLGTVATGQPTEEDDQLVNFSAESTKFNKDKGYYRMFRNVKLTQKGAVLTSDSAHYYPDNNSYIAYENVRVNQGDSLFLYGDKLYYDGNAKTIDITGEVSFTDGKMTLVTRELIFDRANNNIFFPTKGTLTSDQTTLVSKRGTYLTQQKLFLFKDSVRINHPEYQIEADTLLYGSASKTAYFRGPTTLLGDSSFIYCEHGKFNLTTNIADFTQNAYIRDGRSFLRGDSIYYEKETGLGELFGNVFIEDTVQKFFITGQLGIYTQKPEYAFITGDPIYSQVLKLDTLHIYGDTIVIDEIEEGRQLKVSHHVRMFKSDFQGKCDSLYYSDVDSSFTFYRDPVLWNNKTQLTSDEMFITTKNQALDSLHMIGNAFMMNEVDTVHFDQVKGKNMYGTFADNELRTLYVSGNGQTVYYVYDANADSYIGVYRADCSNMVIQLRERRVHTINFMVKPNTILYPLGKIPEGEKRLKGFNPRFDERPTSREGMLEK